MSMAAQCLLFWSASAAQALWGQDDQTMCSAFARDWAERIIAGEY